MINESGVADSYVALWCNSETHDLKAAVLTFSRFAPGSNLRQVVHTHAQSSLMGMPKYNPPPANDRGTFVKAAYP